MSRARVVTLTGVGGVGKTRLAVRVAHEVRRAFPDGVCFVDLAPLRDGSLLARTVTAALGIGDQDRDDRIDPVPEFPNDRRALLILDNCEHVADACAELINVLLRNDARIRVLATSRHALGVTGEHVWLVPPLPVLASRGEGAAHTHDGAEAVGPAVRLFTERAAEAGGGLVAGDDRSEVRELCRRLGGLPLAIELAAAHSRWMSAGQMLKRLDERLEFPESPDRSAPARHRTMRAAVEGSFRLCSPQERLLWARTSVFAGWFGLSAVEGVCSGEGLPVGRLLDLVAGLVSKSVLVQEELKDEMQFQLLDPLARYGRERLRESGREEVWARRHRDWYLGLSQQFQAEWLGPDQVRWSSRMRHQEADLRTALGYCLTTPGEARAGLRMAAALCFHWTAGGRVAEGRYWLEGALALESEPTAARAAALRVLGSLRAIQGDSLAAEAALAECRSLAVRLDDESLAASCVATLGQVALGRGDFATAVALSEESLESERRMTDQGRCSALVVLALAHALHGETEPAVSVAEELGRRCAELGDVVYLSWALLGRAVAEFGRGDARSADTHAREALKIKRDFEDAVGIWTAVMIISWSAAAVGDHHRAAVLLGISEGISRTRDLPADVPTWRTPAERCADDCRQSLGASAFREGVDRGLEYDLDQGIAYTLEVESAVLAEESPKADRRLTPREHEVVALVARGMPNREIATRMMISPRTVENHVRHILMKLGLASRSQIAAWLAQGHNPQNSR